MVKTLNTDNIIKELIQECENVKTQPMSDTLIKDIVENYAVNYDYKLTYFLECNQENVKENLLEFVKNKVKGVAV